MPPVKAAEEVNQDVHTPVLNKKQDRNINMLIVVS